MRKATIIKCIALTLIATLFQGWFLDLSEQNLAVLVDPRIGTEHRPEGDGLACGYTYPGAAWPFGMVQFTPSFFAPEKGFVINQLSGAGCAHMGNFPVIPLAGIIDRSPGGMTGFQPYENILVSHAGYFAASMSDGVQTELTVSDRVGYARFEFPAEGTKGTVIIGSGVNTTKVSDAFVRITSDRSCEGYSEGGDFCGTTTPYRIYFAAEFDRPAEVLGTWEGRKLKKKCRKEAKGPKSGAWFTFDTSPTDHVQYRIAVSFVSVENAKSNLKAQSREFNFESTRNLAEASWNNALGKIRIQSADNDRKVQFYTNLYHSLIHPNLVSDVNGDYMGADFKVHRDTVRPHYSSFSTWDTYRTQAQLLSILFPEESSDMVQSAIDFADQSGGYGRWVLANIETGIMQGDPMSALIANSYAFGARTFDQERAYYHMNRGATIPGLRSQDQEIRPHLSEYIEHGTTFASMMLEYTSADFAIGRFARQALGREKEALMFIERAANWKKIFNPDLNWLNSRYPSGPWKDITHDWREGTYKNYFWMVPYDLHALIDTIGGKDFAEKRLDTLFLRLDASYHDDWFASGNEPDFQVPWIYNWTNAPWKTSQVIDRILTEMYNSSPSGLPGNEDLGAMGAWYVFASIGLYPMIPGVGGVTVSAPQFDKVQIDLKGGELLIQGGGPGRYIQSLNLNGSEYRSTWVDWKELENGGRLNYETTKDPDPNWGISIDPP